jgi:hypothetical protein
MRSFAAMGDLEVWHARLDAEAMLARLRDEHDRRSARDLRRTVAKAHRARSRTDHVPTPQHVE